MDVISTTLKVYGRVGEFGLIAPYKNDQAFKGIVRKIMALGFLPLQFVSGVFDVLRTSGLVRHQLQLYLGFQRLLDYVRNTYILP